MLFYLVILITCQYVMCLPSNSEFREYSLRLGKQNKDIQTWKCGVIPFEITGSFTVKDRQLIITAMNLIHKYTCIRFQSRTLSDIDYISIDSRYSECSTDVGRKGGKQIMKLSSSGCLAKIGFILHELLHVVGLEHEHNRWDRDSYVQINWENIKSSGRHYFMKRDELKPYEVGLPYDYNSLLHFTSHHFSMNKEDTIVPSVEYTRMGQNDGLSKGDIRRVNSLYGCTDNNIDNGYRLVYDGFAGNDTDDDLLGNLDIVVPWAVPKA